MKPQKYEPRHSAEKKNNTNISRKLSEPKELKVKKKSKHSFWKTIIIILAVIVALLLAAYLVFANFYSKMNVESVDKAEIASSFDLSDPDVQALDSPEIVNTIDPSFDYSNKAVSNYLILGVDNDNLAGLNELGNADGIILASINKDTKQVVLTSFMRDISVSVNNEYKTKLTSVYHYGGVPLMIETMEKNFGIKINNYALFNYLNVIDIVDAFGGVTVNVTPDEIIWMEPKILNINELRGNPGRDNVLKEDDAGVVTLNGVQTAAYMRIRYAGDGDRERTERIRRVILALKDKALDMNISELIKMANVIFPCINTDLSQKEIISIVFNALDILNYDMVSQRIPIEESYYELNEGGSFEIIDFKTNNSYLYYTIFEGHEPVA